jgi:hypothetical protein
MAVRELGVAPGLLALPALGRRREVRGDVAPTSGSDGVTASIMHFDMPR